MITQEEKSLKNEHKKRFEISIYSAFNIFYFYNVKEFKKFIKGQIELWQVESATSSIWNEVLKNFHNINTKVEILDIKSPYKETNEFASTVEQIRLTTFQHPLFIYNKNAIDFINTFERHNAHWGIIIINQIINPDNTNIYSQNYKIVTAYQHVLSFLNASNQTIDEYRQLNQKSNELHDIQIKNLESWQEEQLRLSKFQEEQFSKFINGSTVALEEFLTGHQKTFSQIQTTFSEKVRIDEPAKLWATKMEEYKDRGRKWTWFSIADSIVIAGICFCFFKFFPLTFVTSEVGLINLTSTIKWVVLTGIGLGTFIYLLRLFVKLALSSFHMSRDAEEKSALTSFYLSLIHNGGIDPEKEKELKNIIMNALFARVDTGLLKGDTSPTIPTSGLSEVVRLVSGPKP